MRVVRSPFPLPLFLVLAGGAMLAAAPAAASPVASRGASARPVLPFISDDYARALAEARTRKVPLFIESWAPW